MTRLALFGLILTAAGCTRYEGPLEVYEKNRRGDRADLPGYTIEEQKARARERLTTFEDDRERYPTSQVDRPGGVGR
jgi:hypothetical protein